nr:hypothetical protein [Tanacetum cinerariifolium]
RGSDLMALMDRFGIKGCDGRLKTLPRL